MRPLRNWLSAIFLGIPIIFAIYWTVAPALAAKYATLKYLPTSIKVDQARSQHATITAKRQIQKFFLNENIYVPLDDIFISTDFLENDPALSLLMQNACGQAKLYVWIPLKFRIPIFGDRVFDWCWKPQ